MMLVGQPDLDISDDDENSRAMVDRVRVLTRDRIENPDQTVVDITKERKDAELGREALAQLVEYTMARIVFDRFPPRIPSDEQLLTEHASRSTS